MNEYAWKNCELHVLSCVCPFGLRSCFPWWGALFSCSRFPDIDFLESSIHKLFQTALSNPASSPISWYLFLAPLWPPFPSCIVLTAFLPAPGPFHGMLCYLREGHLFHFTHRNWAWQWVLSLPNCFI